MPKYRKTGRLIKKRIFIVCEGKKTEPYYFSELVGDINFRGKPVDIRIIDSKKNTAKEMIEFARNLREFKGDDVWVVFDRDGYTKHPLAFQLAHEYNIHIAFSSISFEYWVLLHFHYIFKEFHNSYEVINYMRVKHFMNFKKNDRNTYSKIKHLTNYAIQNAEKLRFKQRSAHPNKNIYDMNPYTNVDLLIKSIDRLKNIYN